MQKQPQFNSFPQIVGTLRGRESLSAALSFLSLFQLIPSLGPSSSGFTFHHNIPKWDGRKHKTKPNISLFSFSVTGKGPRCTHRAPAGGTPRSRNIWKYESIPTVVGSWLSGDERERQHSYWRCHEWNIYLWKPYRAGIFSSLNLN